MVLRGTCEALGRQPVHVSVTDSQRLPSLVFRPTGTHHFPHVPDRDQSRRQQTCGVVHAMNKPANQRQMQGWIRLWRNVLVISCVGMVALVLAVNWVLSGFHGLGLHPATALALVLGTVATTALCVVLMGLMFYSERAQDDEEVHEGRTTDHWC